MSNINRYWKVVTGALLAAAGGVAIISAWLRVRDLLEVADQIPLLVSGGMGGLALVVAGIWLLRSHETELLLSHLRHNAERLERVEDDVSRLSSLFAGARVEIEGWPDRAGRMTALASPAGGSEAGHLL